MANMFSFFGNVAQQLSKAVQTGLHRWTIQEYRLGKPFGGVQNVQSTNPTTTYKVTGAPGGGPGWTWRINQVDQNGRIFETKWVTGPKVNTLTLTTRPGTVPTVVIPRAALQPGGLAKSFQSVAQKLQAQRPMFQLTRPALVRPSIGPQRVMVYQTPQKAVDTTADTDWTDDSPDAADYAVDDYAADQNRDRSDDDGFRSDEYDTPEDDYTTSSGCGRMNRVSSGGRYRW